MSWFTDEEVDEIQKKLNIDQDFYTYRTHLNEMAGWWSKILYRQESEFGYCNFDIVNKEKLDRLRLKEPAINYILDKAILSIGADFELEYPGIEQKLRAKLKE
ncbi:hypothetical protein QNI19_09090 [Cytophagaceae bacterium DM2B3-1]|uniref:Uncharacterized protein n=1 Tax=Xanthocytophaga flava TaxID=3048013 RepID=A0ABT7CHS5_9BACT|nr:hypothetical protein [Xanthocytophaga flavus]MDJ1493086.1 hypothetical protein [Xanthocytophaga flavus]